MSAHLALVPSTVSVCRGRDHGLRLMQRIFLYPNELYRVPPIYRQVRASQGIAYISQGGKDFVVPTNEYIALGQSTDVALVSPLRNETLILELFL